MPQKGHVAYRVFVTAHQSLPGLQTSKKLLINICVQVHYKPCVAYGNDSRGIWTVMFSKMNDPTLFHCNLSEESQLFPKFLIPGST